MLHYIISREWLPKTYPVPADAKLPEIRQQQVNQCETKLSKPESAKFPTSGFKEWLQKRI